MIQKWQFFTRDQIDDVVRSILMNKQEKIGFSCIWSIFLTISRHSTKTAGEYVKELS